jgi:uncharacterized membrane protein
MHIFTTLVPFIIGFLTMISVPALPAGIVMYVLSHTSKEEQKRKDYRLISYILFSPVLLMLLVVILWGFVGFIQNL